MTGQGPFQRLISDFGGEKEEKKEDDEAAEEIAIETADEKRGAKPLDVKLSRKMMGRAAGRGTVEGRLMVSEGEFWRHVGLDYTYRTVPPSVRKTGSVRCKRQPLARRPG